MNAIIPSLMPRFSSADIQRAHDEWGCNCGPAAIAAICDLTLDEVRPALGDFEAKGYTNPTLMFAILDRLDVAWRRSSIDRWPAFGLVRVQWEGPWTEPGVPARVAYRHTHWIGARCASERSRNAGIFDVNCGHWISDRDWQQTLVPWLLAECEPKANGRWHRTHVVEVSRTPTPPTVNSGDGT